MTLRGEILGHLGKDEIKSFLDSPSIMSYWKILRALAFLVFITLYWLFYKISSGILYGMKIAMPSTRSFFETYFESGFWTLCIYILEINQIKINIVGDHLENENALIISNHRSIVDHVIFPYLTRRTLKEKDLQSEFSFGSDSEDEIEKKGKKEQNKKEKKEVKKGSKIKFKILNNEEPIFAKDLTTMLIPKVQFFTWFSIWGIPSVDYFSHISQADENWEMDGETLVAVFHEYLDSTNFNNTKWLTLFPEVNIFSEKDLKMQNIMGEKHYLPQFENVLYPRFGGFANAVGGMYKTNFTRLYDITLLYYNRNMITGEIIDFKPPTLLSILGVRDSSIDTVILVHVAGKFLNRVPLKRNKLEKYLENRWIKKDKLITKLEKRLLKENESLLVLKQANADAVKA